MHPYFKYTLLTYNKIHKKYCIKHNATGKRMSYLEKAQNIKLTCLSKPHLLRYQHIVLKTEVCNTEALFYMVIQSQNYYRELICDLSQIYPLIHTHVHCLPFPCAFVWGNLVDLKMMIQYNIRYWRPLSIYWFKKEKQHSPTLMAWGQRDSCPSGPLY